MRLLECCIICIEAVYVVALFLPPARRSRFVCLLPVVSILVIAAHLVFEGFRWQIVPAYSLALLLNIFTLPGVVPVNGNKTCTIPKGKPRNRFVGATLSILALVMAAALPVLFPHLTLPVPTGSYNIGTTNIYFTDMDRPELFTHDPDDHREVCALVWYPAEKPENVSFTGYSGNAHEISRVLTSKTPFPSFLFDHMSLVRTHSYRNADVLDDGQPFPVVIFSHSYWGSVRQNTVLMEELASHGYVAISIGHAHETPYFITEDGGVRAFDPYNEEFQLRGSERNKTVGLTSHLTEISNSDELLRALCEISSLRPKGLESLHIWSADISSTINELERLNCKGEQFAGRLDLNRLGVIGHSMGGAASGQACMVDARCIAGVNMDGMQLGNMLDENLTKPFMFMHHDNPAASHKALNRAFFEQAEDAAYMLIINDTRHLNFTDFSLYGAGSIPRFTNTIGKVNGGRCLRIINHYVVAFFDQHLKGEKSPFLNDPSIFRDEVIFSMHPPKQ